MSTASRSTNFDAMPQFEQSLGREGSGHVVQLYSDDGFLLEILTGFIGGALAAGDGALVVATRAHADSLEQCMRERGLDTGKAIRQARSARLLLG